jgi:hypothetical protein
MALVAVRSLPRKEQEAHMVFLTGEPDITPITNLITTWIRIGKRWSDLSARLRSSSRKRACHKDCSGHRSYNRLRC